MIRRPTESETRIKRMILIVDDNDDARSLLGSHFRSAGYDVAMAASGNEGIAAALRIRPSVIVLDLAMPGLDGWGTMRLLRAYASTAKIPLLAWSGFGGGAAVVRAATPGFDVVLRKPCAPEDVERAVDGLLARALPEDSNIG